MGFRYKKSLGGVPAYHTVIIDNDDAIQTGDMVQIRNGNIEIADGSTEAVAGVVVDIVDRDGNSLVEQGSLSKIGSATRDGDTVTVATDNETVDLIAAKIDFSKCSIWSASVTGTMNTTNASAKPGGWVDLVSTGDGVDETTHTRTIGTAGVLKSWGEDPDDTDRMLVSINESEIFDPGTGGALT